MKLVVALALSANAFSPATPGGAKPREKAIPTSSAQSRSYSDARARRGRIDHRWTHAGARGAALRADRVFSPAEAKGGSAIDASKTALLLDADGVRERYVKSHNAIAATPPPACAGFNTVTLTDCCATTSAEGQAGATGGTFGMFSDPMTADDFVAKL
jgi:hypothetical protein